MEELRVANKYILQEKKVEVHMGKGIFDVRLPLFGYTTETVNMLLTPMFKNR